MDDETIWGGWGHHSPPQESMRHEFLFPQVLSHFVLIITSQANRESRSHPPSFSTHPLTSFPRCVWVCVRTRLHSLHPYVCSVLSFICMQHTGWWLVQLSFLGSVCPSPPTAVDFIANGSWLASSPELSPPKNGLFTQEKSLFPSWIQPSA